MDWSWKGVSFALISFIIGFMFGVRYSKHIIAFMFEQLNKAMAGVSF